MRSKEWEISLWRKDNPKEIKDIYIYMFPKMWEHMLTEDFLNNFKQYFPLKKFSKVWF